MGFNFSFGFGFGNHKDKGPHGHEHGPFGHDDHENHHHFGHIGPMEIGMVEHGQGVFAYIEKSGFSFSGDVPGVSGIHRVILENSFEDCYKKMADSVRSSIDVSFSSFKQKESLESIRNSHPNAEIVFIKVK